MGLEVLKVVLEGCKRGYKRVDLSMSAQEYYQSEKKETVCESRS